MGIEEFLRGRETIKKLRKVAAAGRKSLVITFDQLLEHDMKLARELIDSPSDFLNKADEILEDITKIPKMRLRVRDVRDRRPMRTDEIRAEHIDKFIEVEGAVTQAGGLKFIRDNEDYRDYQRIRVNGLDVDLAEDLVGEANEGNKIIATGVLKATPTTVPNQFEKLLAANYIVLPDKEECQRKGGVWDGVSCRVEEEA